MSEQTGKLTVVARTAGIKLNIQGVETNWINPTDAAKKEILPKIDDFQKLKNTDVVVTLEDDGKYLSVVPCEANADPTPTEEDIEEEKPLEVVAEVIVDKKTNVATVQSVKTICSPKAFVSANKIDESFDEEYYQELHRITAESKKLGNLNLTYISWAEAWDQLKKVHPDAQYKVYENEGGLPYFYDQTGGMVKVGVTVNSLEHIVFLPIMNHSNKTIPLVGITTFDINKSVQRAFAKAIAMHGLGLYVYKGEDLPEK